MTKKEKARARKILRAGLRGLSSALYVESSLNTLSRRYSKPSKSGTTTSPSDRPIRPHKDLPKNTKLGWVNQYEFYDATLDLYEKETTRISLYVYKKGAGKEAKFKLDLRRWYRNKAGEWKVSHQGIRFEIQYAGQIAARMAKLAKRHEEIPLLKLRQTT
jgi:hypothetical protein